MASDIDIYRCRCGSEDLDMGEDGVATCRRCGASFLAQEGISKFKILPECDEGYFIRRSWIRMASLDVPAEVFEEGFLKSGKMEYLVATSSVEVRLPFRVLAGYDRQEAYYETVTRQEYEYVPARNRYEYVTKKEQELRYRTVTDWKPYSSVHEASSSVTLLNGKDVFSMPATTFEGDEEESFGLGFAEEKADPSMIFFDKTLFLKALNGAKGSFVSAPDAFEAERMKLDPKAAAEADRLHEKTAVDSMKSAIPGDRYRNLSYTYQTAKSCTQLYLVSEYYATISCSCGETALRCLPFGDRPLCGGEMRNEKGLASYRKDKINGLKNDSREVREAHSKTKWEQDKKMLFAALIMLAVTFLGMLFVDIASLSTGYKNNYISLFVLGIVFFALFLAAVAVCIYFAVRIRRKDREVDSKEKENVSGMEEAANAEIDEFAKTYKSDKLLLLNRKLESLNLDPATEEDISGLDDLALPYDEKRDGGKKKRNSFDKKNLALKAANVILLVLGIAAAVAVAAFTFVIR